MRNPIRERRRLLGAFCVVVAALAAVATVAPDTLAQAVTGRSWRPLQDDGIHDRANPSLRLLQEPREALSALPADTAGNLVRWVQAIQGRHIEPRTNIHPETKFELRTTEVLLKRTGEMPMVVFPHRVHTEWLDCVNCHDEIFARQAGRTQINMFMILQGEKCGLCHGAVAFPLTECQRCHSLSRGNGDEHTFRELVRQ